MKSNNYKIDFLNKEIRVTKSFYQSAQIFGTEECNIMIAIKEKLPDYEITFQNTARRTAQMWYPTYEQMMDYLRTTDQGDDKLSELKSLIEYARSSGHGYNIVRKWFMAQCPDTYYAPDYENIICPIAS